MNRFDILTLFEDITDMKGKIRVYARWRPLSDKELRDRERLVLAAPDDFTIEHPWRDEKTKQHQFDQVFDNFATQEQVFEDTKVGESILSGSSFTPCNFLESNYMLMKCCVESSPSRVARRCQFFIKVL